MDRRIIRYFSEITDEEKQFLSGDRQIDRTLYMDGSRDVISGDAQRVYKLTADHSCAVNQYFHTLPPS